MENQFTIYKNFAIISDFAYCKNGCEIGEIIEGTDYKLLSYKNDNGFQAGLFENIKTKEKIISVRGTDNPLSKKNIL